VRAVAIQGGAKAKRLLRSCANSGGKRPAGNGEAFETKKKNKVVDGLHEAKAKKKGEEVGRR